MAQCAICGASPTHYIGGSGKEFCKDHYDDAKLSMRPVTMQKIKRELKRVRIFPSASDIRNGIHRGAKRDYPHHSL